MMDLAPILTGIAVAGLICQATAACLSLLR